MITTYIYIFMICIAYLQIKISPSDLKSVRLTAKPQLLQGPPKLSKPIDCS